MVFIPDTIPPLEQSLDNSVRYAADVPFDHKQATISQKRHRWFQPYVIVTPADGSRGLAAGATLRIQFDHRPDWIIVAISGETAVTGRVWVYAGDPGGPYFSLGPHGKLSLPAPEGGIITLVSAPGTTTRTYGMVTAVGGYTDPGIDITLGD
jgi:hypothetical protein